VGGDICVLGESFDGEPSWLIGIEDPESPSGHLGRIALQQGGVATSGTTIRRWTTPSGESAHHLIDPKTALPASTSLLTATIIAGDTATAEVFATAAMMGDGPSAVAMLERVGLAGFMVGTDLTVYTTKTLEAFQA
jgi:thiamine biosynthesis lipoprotein